MFSGSRPRFGGSNNFGEALCRSSGPFDDPQQLLIRTVAGLYRLQVMVENPLPGVSLLGGGSEQASMLMSPCRSCMTSSLQMDSRWESAACSLLRKVVLSDRWKLYLAPLVISGSPLPSGLMRLQHSKVMRLQHFHRGHGRLSIGHMERRETTLSYLILYGNLQIHGPEMRCWKL